MTFSQKSLGSRYGMERWNQVRLHSAALSPLYMTRDIAFHSDEDLPDESEDEDDEKEIDMSKIPGRVTHATDFSYRHFHILEPPETFTQRCLYDICLIFT